MAKVNVEKTVITYCREIGNKVRVNRLKAGTKYNIRDYPAVAIVASDHSLTYSARGTSYWSNSAYYDNVPKLQQRLNSIGKIGSQSPICNNYIGACAEPHAAKAILSHFRNKVGLKSIVFSTAYRPRTMEPVDRCDNCKRTF